MNGKPAENKRTAGGFTESTDLVRKLTVRAAAAALAATQIEAILGVQEIRGQLLVIVKN